MSPDRIALNPTASSFHHSRLIRAGDLLFLAGHVAREGGIGEIKASTVAGQTTEILRQFEAALRLANATLARLVQVTAYLTRREDFAEFDAAYRAFFPADPPARTTVIAQLLPPGALIEMDGIASL